MIIKIHNIEICNDDSGGIVLQQNNVISKDVETIILSKHQIKSFIEAFADASKHCYQAE
jgi:hypothetical protein